MAVELTKSAKASVKDIENIRLLKGKAKKTAEKVVRRKRKQASGLALATAAFNRANGVGRGKRANQSTDSNQ
jgi:hypothetical protein